MTPSLEKPESDAPQAPGNSPAATANPGYALWRIAAALATSQDHPDPETRLRAQTKVSDWIRVLEGMLSGGIRVGSRTPVAQVPAWATLEVVQGGFATGALLAEGSLQHHEEILLSRINPESSSTVPEPSARARINRYYLSEAGMAELQHMLRTGNYRVDIPEEGALLVVAWLLQQDQAEAARRILDAIGPYLYRLRFYPIPDDRPQQDDGIRVRLQNVGQTVRDLEAVRPPIAFLKQRESALVWAPFFDKIVGLFLETVEGPAPFLRTGHGGESGVDGGWPCQHYSADWRERGRVLVQEYRLLRNRHTLCAKPERAGTNFAVLRLALETCMEDPARLTGRDVSRIRGVLARVIARRGMPASEQCRSLRREQERRANRPTNAELAQVVIGRLATRDPDGGIDDLGELSDVLLPVTEAEAQRRVPAGETMAERFGKKVRRCLLAPPEVLVEQNVLTSGEVLARVVPQITSQVSAAGFADADLRTLYGAVYRAFRRRRSLLLLNLESQVKLAELPWMQAVAAHQSKDGATRERAQLTFMQVATLALTSFPQQIVPNKLLQEFRALATTAELKDEGLPIPLVDEVAADIFMGAFSPKFLHAAKIAGRLLEGTLYERYYGLSYARVREINDVPPPREQLRQRYESAPTSPGFYQMCNELAEREREAVTGAGITGTGGSWVARNGMIIEQEQILTTHNLALLFMVFGETLAHRRGELARRCFAWICRRNSQTPSNWKARLQLVKNSAYAWRQMVFFLSLESEEDARAFLPWAMEHLGEQPEAFRERFGPVLSGLDSAIRGLPITGDDDASSIGVSVSARRFLGWTTEKHWLLP
ncbi:MAG: hypothetical protein H7145_09325 [Akkermansiaceae bacterium]|nr:hypothetical protein [Armatimonadota bacterium]